jgi:hypothetical protein
MCIIRKNTVHLRPHTWSTQKALYIYCTAVAGRNSQFCSIQLHPHILSQGIVCRQHHYILYCSSRWTLSSMLFFCIHIFDLKIKFADSITIYCTVVAGRDCQFYTVLFIWIHIFDLKVWSKDNLTIYCTVVAGGVSSSIQFICILYMYLISRYRLQTTSLYCTVHILYCSSR